MSKIFAVVPTDPLSVPFKLTYKFRVQEMVQDPRPRWAHPSFELAVDAIKLERYLVAFKL